MNQDLSSCARIFGRFVVPRSYAIVLAQERETSTRTLRSIRFQSEIVLHNVHDGERRQVNAEDRETLRVVPT